MTSEGSVWGFLVPRGGFAAVGEVAEPLIRRAGPRVALLHAQLSQAKAAGTDPLLCVLDEDRADPARLQRPVNRQLPQRSGTGGLGVVDPAERDRQARRRADREIVDLAAPGTQDSTMRDAPAEVGIRR